MPNFKETYEAIKADTDKGEKNFVVECKMMPDGMQTLCKMGAKPYEVLIDAPPGLDGTNEGPSPLLIILTAVGGCIVAVIKFWSKIMDIELTELKVLSRGHINLAAIFGIDDNMLPGYDKLQPVIKIKSPAPKEKVEEMVKKALAHTPIITNMNRESGLTPKIQIKQV